MMHQLNPMIPVETPKGSGWVLLVIDYSQEHDLMWVVALDGDGQVWTFANPSIRVQENYTFGRSS